MFRGNYMFAYTLAVLIDYVIPSAVFRLHIDRLIALMESGF